MQLSEVKSQSEDNGLWNYNDLLSIQDKEVLDDAKIDAITADSLFNNADSIQKLIDGQKSILSSEYNPTESLTGQMNYFFVKALEINIRSNDKKIGIFYPIIESLKPDLIQDPEYSTSINKLYSNSDSLKWNLSNLNEIIAVEQDTNILLDKMTEAFGIGKKVISSYHEIFTLKKIISEAKKYNNETSSNTLNDTAEENHLIVFKKEEMAIGDNDPEKYVQVIVNEKVIETFRIYKENSEDDTVADIFNISTFDVDLILQALDNYVEEAEDLAYIPPAEEKENITENTSAELVTENTEFVETNETKIIPDNNVTNEITSSVEPNIVEEKKSNNNTSKNTYHPATESINTTDDKLIFRVQIAAHNKQISESKLKDIYKGDFPIKMFQEEGWYKYYIADCETLSKAILIKKQSNVADAFIMAYSNGKKIPFFLKYVKSPEKKSYLIEFNDLVEMSKDQRVIVVQIAASKESLSNKDLQEIYEGDLKLNIINEEGWVKYSIGNFSKFRQANALRKKCGVDDAFVVAYKNGNKVDLWSKKDKNKENKN
jgi:hypothetical protein